MGKYIKVALALSIVAFLLFVLHPLSAAQKYGLIPYYDAIPNIVHYVYIKKDDDSRIEFHFADFLSLYASIMYVGASKVYIHSDFNTTEISEASVHGNEWTRKVMNSFPDKVEWNAVRAPNYSGTNEKMPIKAIQHKSDFVRWEGITPIGGVYMDWDVVVLRPLKPLLTAGFAFVAGRQMGPNTGDDDGSKQKTNNGVFMTRPNSLMARIMQREQSSNFAGDFESNLRFMTSVAERLVSIPGEVLICDRNAFAPTHWGAGSKNGLFLHHEDLPSPEPVDTSSADPLDMYDNIVTNRRNRHEWEWDLSSSYTLHAFGQSKYNEWITPKKILARTSNYGVAVWPTVKKMVEDGLIMGTEDTW
ncbi:hypothetical protein N0V90_003202 [Kalmusia sp. IMI 367209]|nr:hypothetical protein N0V90_003202 [Kalmusia sp. IMI 367209]